jgi:L-amino acid N-acyltransferase YncA
MANFTDNKPNPTTFSRLKAKEFIELVKNTDTPTETAKRFVYVDSNDILVYWNGSTTNKQAVQYKEMTLSAAQIKTLYSANTNKGIEVVPAPGANKVIEFLSATLFYDYDGTNAYTAANGLTFNVETTAVGVLITNTLLQATADTIAIAEKLSAVLVGASAGLVNKPLYLQEGTQNPSGSATIANQLRIRVSYIVHDVA